MSRVFVVRHGNTFDSGDVILRVGGGTDLPLSASGRKQAEALRDHFAGHELGASYSSNLKRTRQTAETILGSQPYELADFLIEIDYGPDEGRPEKDVIARLGAETLKLWDEKSIPPPDWYVDAAGLRVAWMEFLARCSTSSDTLVVTSNGVARFLLDVVEGGYVARRKLRTGAYGVIELRPTGPVLIDWDIRPAMK